MTEAASAARILVVERVMPHFYLAWLLVGSLVLHVLAALYHQFFLRDGLFRRIALGRSRSGGSAPAQ